jgi:methionine-rich copper-binding protein CopC/putative copper export protein
VKFIGIARYRLLYALLFTFVLLTFQPPEHVHAHAFLESASPPQEARLTQSPEQIILKFTEKINHEFCEIELIGDNGTTVKHPVEAVDEDSMRMNLPILPNGVYMVNWQVLSVDTHVTEDAYQFAIGVDWSGNVPQETVSLGAEMANEETVEPSVATETIAKTEPLPTDTESARQSAIVPDLEGSPQENIKSSENPSVTGQAVEPHEQHEHHAHGNHQENDGHILHTVTRIVDVLVAVTVVGVLFFRLVVHRGLPLPLLTWFTRSNERKWLLLAIAVSVVTGIVHVWHLAAQLAGEKGTSLADMGILFFSTLLGLSAVLKVIFYLAALASPWAYVRFALAVFVLVLFPLSGHAMAASIPIAAITFHALHMLMTACWLGGLIGIARAAFVPAVDSDTVQALYQMMKRFSSWALPLLMITVLSGFASAIDKVSTFSDLWSTMYGWILLAKVLLVLVLVCIAMYQRTYRMPHVQSNPEVVHTMHTGFRWQIAVMFLAFLLAGLLSVTPPGS